MEPDRTHRLDKLTAVVQMKMLLNQTYFYHQYTVYMSCRALMQTASRDSTLTCIELAQPDACGVRSQVASAEL